MLYCTGNYSYSLLTQVLFLCIITFTMNQKLYRRIVLSRKNNCSTQNKIHYIINFNSAESLFYFKTLKQQEIKKGMDWETSLFVRMRIQDRYCKPYENRKPWGSTTKLVGGKWVSMWPESQELPF